MANSRLLIICGAVVTSLCTCWRQRRTKASAARIGVQIERPDTRRPERRRLADAAAQRNSRSSDFRYLTQRPKSVARNIERYAPPTSPLVGQPSLEGPQIRQSCSNTEKRSDGMQLTPQHKLGA